MDNENYESENKKDPNDFEEKITVVKTDTNAKDGQSKCPKCGSTDINLDVKSGKLQCNFCRHKFDIVKADKMGNYIKDLKGTVIGSGAQDIEEDASDIKAIKCTSCGAEVIIDTSKTTQSRCHWCRNTLSINEQIDNGGVPDVVLPFSVYKEEAKKSIENFVGKRKFFINSKFKREFEPSNIMGVYLPYMVIDVNGHINMKGQGEHEIRRYTLGDTNNEKTYYDAELFDIEREFDLTIEGLTIESSKDKLDISNKKKTNNIINAIMPFDTENCVKWDANYIKGYTSEKRDTNIEQLRGLVKEQSKDIATSLANNTLEYYDRGVRWDKRGLETRGEQWKSAYLPVWLYSYHEKKREKSIFHYVAVNARTKETMGSVPINMPKLLLMSFFVEILGLISSIFLINSSNENWPLTFLLAGFIFFGIVYGRYRNKDARHYHETETNADMANVRREDRFIQEETRLTESTMFGANNNMTSKSSKIEDILGSLTERAKDELKDRIG